MSTWLCFATQMSVIGKLCLGRCPAQRKDCWGTPAIRVGKAPWQWQRQGHALCPLSRKLTHKLRNSSNWQQKGDGKLCTTVETILQRCLEQNQAYRAQIQPGHVGIHPRNRDGGGVSWPHCHKLGNDLATLGFLWEECRHAVCIEDDDKKCIAEFTANFVAASKPHLAQVDARDIRYGSLSCSHTNQFLCAAIAGCHALSQH